MRRGLGAALGLAALLLAACDGKPLDWNSLAASRIRDQVPGAEIKVVDAKTLDATFNGNTQRIDTAELSLLCNRGPKDCNRAFDEVIDKLRGPAKVAPK